MPQLDVLKYFSQFFWLLISFGILFFYCKLVFIPKISSIITYRRDYFDKKIASSHILEEKSSAIKDSIKIQIKMADLEAKNVIDQGMLDLEKRKNQEIQERGRVLKRDFEVLKMDLEGQKKKELSSLDEFIEKSSIIILEKVI